jgi:uncharacterized membrane protein YraQ (UPF0718 family)
MWETVLQIVVESIQFFLKVWHWIALGFVAAGFIREFVPQKPLVRMLGGGDPGTIVKASVLGVFADFLPHSSLQLAISLFDLGASRAAILTFLTSTPWLCIVESITLLSFTGLGLFLVIVVMTVVAAAAGGLILAYLEKERIIESWRPTTVTTDLQRHRGPEGSRGRVVSALTYSYTFLKLGGPWLTLGFLGSGIAKTLLPSDAIDGLLGYSIYSVPLALGIAAVMEITLEASIPIICSLYTLGASPGVVFTLLMGGIVTDITEMGTIATIMGKKTAIASVLVYSSVTMLFGYLINLILAS